jgi:hypothetical protein
MNITRIIASISSGIYAVVIFALLSRVFSAKQYLANKGIFNKWVVLIFLLFTFGFIKNEIGYYLTESNNCKQTAICEDAMWNNNNTLIDRLKSAIGFIATFWLENVGEGIVFILVGLPAFIIMENKLFAAFITGILADIFSEYSGLHKYFCRTSCNVNPLYL